MGPLINDEHRYDFIWRQWPLCSSVVKKEKHASEATSPQHRLAWGRGETAPLRVEEKTHFTQSVTYIYCLSIFNLTSVYAANINLESLTAWFLLARLCLFALPSAVTPPQHLNTLSHINRTVRRGGRSLKHLCLVKTLLSLKSRWVTRVRRWQLFFSFCFFF